MFSSGRIRTLRNLERYPERASPALTPSVREEQGKYCTVSTLAAHLQHDARYPLAKWHAINDVQLTVIRQDSTRGF